MTVTNLATIFGPNILHRYKKSSSSNGDGHHYQVSRSYLLKYQIKISS